jgi:glycosyltransferase involved in cell wall biosynthesis
MQIETMNSATLKTKPRFTVIIPTKNRAEYLAHTLRTCMIQNYEPFEVIVSDDGSTDNTLEVVADASHRDSRIRYTEPQNTKGMRDNFEHALSETKPGYVIALGGDDGLLPNGIQGMFDVLQSTGTELLAWPAPIYTYPGVRGSAGQLIVSRRKGSKLVNSREFLQRQAQTLHYLSDVESPMFYVKGVVSTALVDRVRQRAQDGRFYSCPTPDGYSGIVLAGEVQAFAFSSRPYSIFALSPTSQGLAYLDNAKEAKARSESFFQDVSSRPMHSELASQPYSPLITLMTADYLLTAQDLPGWPGIRATIDYRQLLTKSLQEMAHGLYGEDRICRELKILNAIAGYHDLGEFFHERVRRATRYRSRRPYEGTGINTTSFLLDASTCQIENVVDAAYAAQALYSLYSEASLSSMIAILGRSLRYRLASMRSGDKFPPQEAWIK